MKRIQFFLDFLSPLYTTSNKSHFQQFTQLLNLSPNVVCTIPVHSSRFVVTMLKNAIWWFFVSEDSFLYFGKAFGFDRKTDPKVTFLAILRTVHGINMLRALRGKKLIKTSQICTSPQGVLPWGLLLWAVLRWVVLPKGLLPSRFVAFDGCWTEHSLQPLYPVTILCWYSTWYRHMKYEGGSH